MKRTEETTVEDGAAAAPDHAGGAGEPARRSRPARAWARCPRPETMILLVALLGTLVAKLFALVPNKPDHLAVEFVAAALPDIAFISAVATLLAAVHVAGPPRLAARITMLLALPVLVWALANATWLHSTNIQLQPGFLAFAAAHPQESWEVIVPYLTRLRWSVPMGTVAVVSGGWFIARLVRPMPDARTRRGHARAAALAAACFLVAGVASRIPLAGVETSPWGEALSFSSHWYGLTNAARDVSRAEGADDDETTGRFVPRAGARVLMRPRDWPAARPNIVVIFLESVSHPACSLGNPDLDSTPALARLAGEGVEFTPTRVPIALTNKGLWAALTGTTPDLRHDEMGSVLVDEPYESLATILEREAYRTAFFQMAEGKWAAAPALISNLGFGWGWFRENLGDEATKLGWMNGDDFQMLDPMFDWVDASDEPFLLTLITSVAHEPFILPSWYEHEPVPTRRERFLQTVKFTDDFLAAVLGRLEERGLAEDTLVCVLGDHGERFTTEASGARWVPHEEVIRIPWVIRWPGRIEPGTRTSWPNSQLDVAPTILALLGFGLDEAGFEGRSALDPGDAKRRIPFTSLYPGSPAGIVVERRKYVYWPSTERFFVYDLDADPDEEKPVLVAGPERDAIVADLDRWKRASYLRFPARRFRQRRLYDHWQAMSTGRSTSVFFME